MANRSASHESSLRARAMMMIVSTVMIVLLVAGGVIIYQSSDVAIKRSVETTERIVDILAQDFVKILMLGNAETTTDLIAKIESFEQINQLVLFDEAQRPVFEYDRDNGPVPTLVAPAPGIRHHADYFTVAKPIVWKNRNYGLAYLRMADTALDDGLAGYYRAILWLAPTLLLVAILVAFVLQRSFTGPILRLRDTVHRISRDPDDAARLEPEGPPEMAELYDGMNHMLARLHEVKENLRSEKERLQTTFNSIGDGVICTDAEGVIEYTNPEANRLLGYRQRELRNRRMSEVFRAHKEFKPDQAVDPVSSCLEQRRVIGAEHSTLMINRHNVEIPVSTSAAPMWDPDGNITGVVMVIRDVTEARKLARELSHQAAHDELTGLINRRELENRLEQALSSAHEEGSEHVLLYLDLDQFKIVNDTCGHMAGDELLKQLAIVLSDSVRRGDTLARLGGDEFGILLRNCAIKPAQDVAEMLRQTIKGFRFAWENTTFDVSASIGMVKIDSTSESINQLLSQADMACYTAKDAGRNRVSLYHGEDDEVRQRHGEMQWVASINRALQENRFVLYRQMIHPIIDKGNDGEHYEILIRMIDDDGKIVPPGAFLPAAERYNLSPALDRWVIQNTLKQLGNVPDLVDRLSLCSINLSGSSLSDQGFLDFVAAELAGNCVPPSRICFEVTETAAIADLSSACKFISHMKAFGCQFALDDFGAGMSSFGYLKNLDVDYLKIDGMFVKDIATDPIDYSMVKSINEIGQVMGKKTIAEFVENNEILGKLKEIGVDYAQGYGIGVPEPFGEIPQTEEDRDLDKTA